jgi:hypothetical protein
MRELALITIAGDSNQPNTTRIEMHPLRSTLAVASVCRMESPQCAI